MTAPLPPALGFFEWTAATLRPRSAVPWGPAPAPFLEHIVPRGPPGSRFGPSRIAPPAAGPTLAPNPFPLTPRPPFGAGSHPQPVPPMAPPPHPGIPKPAGFEIRT